MRDLTYRQLQPGVPAGEQLEWEEDEVKGQEMLSTEGKRSPVGPVSLTIICHLKH